MFNENEHPRDNGGKFTDKEGTKKSGYDSRDDLGNIRDAQNKNSDKSVSNQDISELLGNEYKGFKGQAAIDKLMNEKQGHIKGAFHRDDIGDIDLLWGNEYLGLKHIILQREKQGIDTQQFMKDLADVVESGNFRKKNDRGNFEFMQNGKVAVISPEIRGNKITFLLTAFKTHSKK